MRGFATVLVGFSATFVLVACGGGSTQTNSTESKPPEPIETAAQHLGEPGEPDLIAVPGYDYVPVDEQSEHKVSDLAEGSPILSAHSVHRVLATEDATPIGSIALFSVRPHWSKQAEEDPMAFIAALATADLPEETRYKPFKVAGERVLYTRFDEIAVFWWYREATVAQLIVPVPPGGASPSPQLVAAVEFLVAYEHEASR